MSGRGDPVRVKICGMRTPADVEVAVRAGADAVGLTCDVDVETPREVDPETARDLNERVPPFVTSVLVTMPTDAAAALELVDRIRPDAIQLHGNLSYAEVVEIRRTIPVIRAFGVDEGAAVQEVTDVVDAILIDSTDPYGAGGTGRAHDWDRTRELVDLLDVPVVLAGGLTPSNVQSAIETARPFAVDVASGVDGENQKDPAAVHAFVTAAKCGGA